MDASPRVGDGLIRLDADGVVQYASPERALRLPPARPRLRPGRPPPRPDHRRTRPDPRPGGRGAGQARQRLGAAGVRGRGRRRRHPAPRHPAQAQGHPHRFAGPAPRRDRTAPPRARVDHQGRDHPGDPPPGEEQPPDGGRAAAAPGPADRFRPAAGRRSKRRCAGSVRSRSCTRRCPRTWTSGSSSTRSPTGCSRWSPRSPRARSTGRRTGRFGILDAEVATPLSMVLTEMLQNALEHGFAPGRARHGRGLRGPRRHRPRRPGCWSPSRTTASVCPRASTRSAPATSACRSYGPWWRASWAARFDMVPAPERRHPGRSWTSRCGPQK